MEKRVDSIETELALVKQELIQLRSSQREMPQWLKNASAAMLMAIFAQTVTAVWWASEITANQNSLKQEVTVNSNFRKDSPKQQQEIMVELAEIKAHNEHMKSMLNEVKNKLRFVDIKTQHDKISDK